MIKRTFKRALSIVLTLVLVATTFFIFDPSTLKMDANAWVEVDPSTMGASLPMQSAKAPETIYLKPGAGTFEYYSELNTDHGTAANSTATSSTIEFSNTSATNVALYVNNVYKKSGKNDSYSALFSANANATGLHLNDGYHTFDGDNNTLKVAAISGTAGTHTSREITSATPIAGNIGSAGSSIRFSFNNGQCHFDCNEGEVHIIEWVVEYKIGANYHYIFMYTGIYKERLLLAGATGYGKNTTALNVPKVAAFAFITGAMDYALTGNRSCVYVGTEAGSDAHPLNGKYAHPLVMFVGQQNNGTKYSIPNESNGYCSATNFPTSGSKMVLMTSGEHDAKDNGENYDIWTEYSSLGTYLNPSPQGGTNHADTTRQMPSNESGTVPVSYMVVDYSRFTNYQQIPFLSAGFVRYYHDRGNDNSQINYIKAGYSPSSNSDTAGGAGITAVGVDTGNHSEDPDSWRSTTYGLYPLSGSTADLATITNHQKNVYLHFRYTQDRTGGDVPVHPNFAIGLAITGVDKDAIRKAYCAGLTSNLDKVTYSDYSSYASSMRTQAFRLCDPTATVGTCTVTENTINTAQNGLVSQNTSDVLTFYVPELIYLAPSTGNMSTFQYYVDRGNSKDSALRTGEQTSGNVYLNVPGATSVSISLSDVSSYTMGTKTGTDTISTTITAGTLSTAIATKGTKRIEWTATYVLNDVTYTSKAYSLVYAPCIETAAAASQAVSARDSRCVEHCSFIYGVHGIETSHLDTCYIGGNKVPDGVDGTGIYNLYPIINKSYTPAVWGAGENVQKTPYFTSSGNGLAYRWEKDAKSSNTISGGVGYITYDSSRYTKYGQIPNFGLGYDFFGMSSGSGDTHGKTEYAGYYVISGQTLSSSNTVSAITTYATTASLNTTTGWHKLADLSNLTLTSGTTLVSYAKTDVRNSKWTYGDGTYSTQTYAMCKVNSVSKTDLRNALNNAIATGKQKEAYTDATWTAYETALHEAADALGNPTADQTTIDAKKNNIGTKAGQLVKATGTIYAKHITTSSNTTSYSGTRVFETESKTYNRGDTAYAGPNDYIGYTFVGGFAPEDLCNNSKSNSGGKLTWDESTNTITFKDTSGGTDNFSSYPGPGASIDGYYYIPVTPGSTMTFKYSVTGASSQIFAFFAGADRKTLPSSGTWLSSRYTNGNLTDSEQTWEFTVPSNCYYITFRLGNQTANGTTYFKNLRYTSTDPYPYIHKNVYDASRNWVMYYEPNTYNVTYNPGGGKFNGETSSKTYQDIAVYDAPFTVGSVTKGGSAAAVPVRTGYIFDHWVNSYDNAEYSNGGVNGSGSSNLPGSISKWTYDTDSISFTAEYTPRDFTVKYDPNGGSLKTGQTNDYANFNYTDVISVANETDSIAKYQWEGHTLIGWATTKTPAAADVIPFGTQNLEVSDFVNAQATDSNPNPDPIYIYAVWSTNSYYLDLNGTLDGVSGGNIAGYGKADVKIGTTLADSNKGLTDYYTQHPYGTDYEILNIIPDTGHYYAGVASGSLIGTVGAGGVNTSVNLKFNTDQYIINLNRNYNSSDSTTYHFGSDPNGKVSYGEELNNFIPTQTGYTFGGWYKERDCSNQVYGTGSTVTIIDHSDACTEETTPVITLYAKWTINTITINYNPGTGSGSVDPVSAAYGSTYETKAASTFTAPEKKTVTLNANGGSGITGTGAYDSTYTFDGWLSSGNNSIIAASTNVTVNESGLGVSSGEVTLTAQWKQNAINLPTVTRTGYDFDGWYNASSGGTRIIEPSATTFTPPADYTPLANKTLYAQWKINAYDLHLYAYSNTLTAESTYAENTTGGGGTVKIGSDGTPGSHVVEAIEFGSSAVAIATPATGYVFDGWYSSAPTASSTGGATGNKTVTINSENQVIWYAKFSVRYCTVTAYAYSNTASAKTTWDNNTTGGTVLAKKVTAGAAGYTEGTTASSTSSGKVTAGGSIKLTAAPATGYHFVGWYESASVSVSDTAISTDANLTVNYPSTSFVAAINRYARFDININTLVVKPNSGKWNNSTADQTFTGVQGDTVSVYVPTRTGYTFDGWQKSSTFTGSLSEGTVTDTLTYTFQTNTQNGKTDTITAQWTAVGYDVAYNLDGGTHGTNHPERATFDTAFCVSAPTKTGYTFAGWTVASGLQTDEATPKYGASASTVTTTITGTCANGATGDVYFLNLRYQAGTVTLKANWNVKKFKVEAYAYSNTAANSGSYVNNTTGGTVKFSTDTGSGSAHVENTSVAFNTSVTLVATPATGYKFDGWYSSAPTSSSTGGATGDKTVTISTENNVVWYAKFSIKSLEVKAYAYSNTASATATYANNTTGGTVKINSGTAGKDATAQVVYGTEFTVTATPATGYTFDGWFTNTGLSTAATGGTVSGNSTTFTKKDATENLYAKFSVKSSVVNVYAYSNATGSYAQNTTGGTVSVEGVSPAVTANAQTITTYYNGTYKVTATPATGYTFDGWFTNTGLSTAATGGTVSGNSTTFTKKDATENLYAKFTITTPKLTVYAYSNVDGSSNYNNNTTGGTVKIGSGTAGASATANVNYGSTASITAVASTGYTFGGWYKAVQGGNGATITGWTTQYSTSATVNTEYMTEARVYYAKFTVKSITITYNANGGSNGTVTSQVVYYITDDSTASVTINGNPSRPGYSLAGWSETSTAETATYGTTIDKDIINNWTSTGSNKTLYAIWQVMRYNTPVYVACDNANNPGAYIVNAPGGSASLKDGVEFIKSGDNILEMIDYEAAAGYQYVDIVYKAISDPSGDITNWGGATSVTTNNIMPVYANGTTVSFIVKFKVLSFPATAYAYCNTAAATDTYTSSAVGGTVKVGTTGAPGSTVTESAYYNDANGVTFYATVKTGYTFDGWYSDAGLNNFITDSTSVKVVINDDRISGNSNINKRYAKFSIVTRTAYARAKYYTEGFDTAKGTGINGDTGGTVTVTAGTSSAVTTGIESVSITVAYTQAVVYTADAKTGYEFVGWYLSPDANDNVNIESADPIETDAEFGFIMPDEDVRIHGKFVPYNFILNLDPNGGVTGPTAAVTLTYGQSVTLDSTAKPTRPSYTFKGWDTESSAETVVFSHEGSNCTIAVRYINQWFADNEDAIVSGDDYTLEIHAVWEIANYTVILDKQGGTGGLSQVEVTYNEAMPSIENDPTADPAVINLPTYAGYKFMGYFDKPGGPEGSIQYYNADGTSANTWRIANGATIYAKWVCPVLKEANYDEETGKWTYIYEGEDGKDVSADPTDKTLDKQGLTDLAPEGAKEVTSVDKPTVGHVETKLEEAKKINLNHYTSAALDDLSDSVKQTNTSLKRDKISQVGLNEYVAKMAGDMEIDVPANKKIIETQKPSIKLYETDAKLSAIKAKNISNPAMSATGATYSTPSSTEASSFLYTNKWSERKQDAVDYYIYTNSKEPVIALEIDDGTVGYNTASYPTKADIRADADAAIVPEFNTDSYSTGAVAATNDISTAWFSKYTQLGIGTGDGSDDDNIAYDYNAKTVVYLTPSFATEGSLSTTDEIVYTITPSDDAYVANTGLTQSTIADVPTGPKASFHSFVDEKPTDEESITVCICYHNSMNGTSDAGGTVNDPYLQLYVDQPDLNKDDAMVYQDTWLNQMHIFRQSAGANNWEIIHADETVYPVDDPDYRNSDYVFGSFAYVFDSTNEPLAASYAEAGNMELAKQAIIKSINDTASDKHDAIMNAGNPEHLQKYGLGLFDIFGWSVNFYPKKGAYVYAHVIDRWGNYFNKVWRCFNVDDYTAIITGTASKGFTIDEDGGSNLANITIDGADINFFTDLDSSYEDSVFITTGNQFKISTGKPKSFLPMTVTDNAGNEVSGKIPTDADGNITFTINDAYMDLTSGAYTFMLNDTEINLYACEPALVRDASMTAVILKGTAATVTVKTSDEAAKIQLVENGVTRTFYNGQSGVAVVDNGDGTLTWTVDIANLTLGEHSFDIKGKDKTGTWHDSIFTVNTLVIEKPVDTTIALQSIDSTSAMVGERAIHKVITKEGTEAVRVIYDNGYSKTAYPTNTTVESVGNGLEVWTITGGAINAAGDYTVSSYAKYDGNWQKDNTLTGTITVKEKAKDSAEIYSVDVVNTTIKAGERAEFTVLTNTETLKLQVVLPGTTTTITPDNAVVEDNGDGTLTWYVSKSYKTVGDNEIVLKAKGETGWTEAQTFGTVTVTK